VEGVEAVQRRLELLGLGSRVELARIVVERSSVSAAQGP
jgi:hypothetical protein